MEKRKLKLMLTCVGLGLIFPLLYYTYFCPENVCWVHNHGPSTDTTDESSSKLLGLESENDQGEGFSAFIRDGGASNEVAAPDRHPLQVSNTKFSPEDLIRDYNFDIEGQDVLVFLHMQKTGGTTFGRHLVRDMILDRPCKCRRKRKRCKCENSKRSIWLFSRFSVGWPCGLHADWTELQSCVALELDKREGTEKRKKYRLLYITILRDPVQRYISEWRHVHRGATWMAAELRCNGRSASLQEVPFCFSDETWAGVTLKEFISCEHNLASNRQTRMLANLSMVGCYNRSAMPQAERERLLLKSAKQNLQDMAFFGMTEFQKDTQFLFEQTFKLKFETEFIQYNSTHANSVDIDPDLLAEVSRVNRLDLELYEFAKNLFLQRVNKMRTLNKKTGEVSPVTASTELGDFGSDMKSVSKVYRGGGKVELIKGHSKGQSLQEEYREEYDEDEQRNNDINIEDAHHRKRRKKGLSIQFPDS